MMWLISCETRVLSGAEAKETSELLALMAAATFNRDPFLRDR
jgi:hypothetical protein